VAAAAANDFMREGKAGEGVDERGMASMQAGWAADVKKTIRII
jgi:hypothetical protein